MKCTLVGSRFFGAKVFEVLRSDGAEIARVVAPATDDRLALAAQEASETPAGRKRSRTTQRADSQPQDGTVVRFERPRQIALTA